MDARKGTLTGPAEGWRPREKAGRYDFAAIEAKWQAYWEKNRTFRTLNPGEPGADASKPKFYVLDMFPYPSGAGLHVGHPLGYCATDIVTRYKRMRGFNVLHPMGFDAFGLPAEQYAIEHNVHPAVTTRKNIEMYRRQLKMFGFSYDWDREVSTCEPDYYRFTQWIFLRMFESWYDEECQWADTRGAKVTGRARPIADLLAELESGRWGVNTCLDIVRTKNAPGRREWSTISEVERRHTINRQRLAYEDEVPVNWCPVLGTVLSNEEVDNEGRSERGGHPVFRRPLRQWMLRITKYSERLIADLDPLDWPEAIKLMQRNWIGRSMGAEVAFPLADKWTIENGRWKHRERAKFEPEELCAEAFPDSIGIYTTRPDTLFGATYVVLAPEHELVSRITTPDRRAEVTAYVTASRNRSDLERTADTKEKTGVFTGAYAINPVNGWKIPIWVADYVLIGYGTGAIMAVPGGDTRDFEFACKFDLPIVAVVRPTASWIESRMKAMTEPLDQTAAAGFEQIAQEFPEHSTEIAEHREKSRNLSNQTRQMLHERVGSELLLKHYEQHPKAWGAAYVEEGVACNSPGTHPGKDHCSQSSGTGDPPLLKNSGTEVNVPGGVCELNGLATPEAKIKIIGWLERAGAGRAAVNYKMRDWVFSRQKYWGEPFPVLHDQKGETIALSDAELPLELPAMEDFKPTPCTGDACDLPEPPLGRAKHWITVERNGKKYRRDLNTMPQWAGSCWYYLRFVDPQNTSRFCGAEAERYWMPVDLYVGGAEHAVLHLLYARFWHKVLYDLGFVSTVEPFQKLFNQGMIQGFAFRDSRGLILRGDQVEEREAETYYHRETGEPVAKIVAKMSKSLKNVVNPDEIISEYGADTFRFYEMFMGPLDAAKPWNTRDVPGLFKLCQRVWRLVIDEETNELSAALTDEAPSADSLRMLHKTIKRVTEDIEHLKMNTAIAAIFDFVNHATPLTKRPRAIIEPFILVLAPFAPHLAEELWARLGHSKTLAYEPWPAWDEKLARDTEVEIAIQIGGKLRGHVTVPADADDKTMERAALSERRVMEALAGKTVRKVIVVKGRLVNIIAN